MTSSQTEGQETIDNSAIEAICQLNLTSLGEGVVVCQGCGERLRDGGRVAAYAFRPCCHAAWVVGQARCGSHPPDLDGLATLGVREVIVTGRVGRCVDQAFQRDWPVVLGAEVEAVSPRGSRDSVSVSESLVSEVACPLKMVASEEGA